MSVAENYSKVIADLLASDPDAAIALWDTVTRNDDVPFVMDVHARLSALGSLDPLVEALSKKAGPRFGTAERTSQTDSQKHDLWSVKGS
jgi:hypothetical protein|tara:strand:+ start:519 stop:785 length:267 start_codon:yes stop_codon:yes gene_type:complete